MFENKKNIENKMHLRTQRLFVERVDENAAIFSSQQSQGVGLVFCWSIVCVNVKGVVNCQNSRDKGPPEGNSARG